MSVRRFLQDGAPCRVISGEEFRSDDAVDANTPGLISDLISCVVRLSARVDLCSVLILAVCIINAAAAAALR